MALARKLPSMMTYLPAAMFALMLSAVMSCGQQNDASSVPHRDAEAEQATGLLLVQKRPAAAWPDFQNEAFCSGTLIAPDVVVTSARCANVARTAQVAFVTDTQQHAAPTLVRSVMISRQALGVPCAAADDLFADAKNPQAFAAPADPVPADAAAVPAGAGDNADPAVRQAACRALRARCGVRNIAAPDAITWGCLHAQPASLLRQAAYLGFGPGYDLGLLFLEQPMPHTPATLAAACVQNAFLHAGAEVSTQGFMRHAHLAQGSTGKTAALHKVDRFDTLRSVRDVAVNEVAIAAISGLDATDRGSALMVRYGATAESASWHLTAVASRPWLAGADSDTGIIYTRIDDAALAWIEESLAQARTQGWRIDGVSDTAFVTTKLVPSENCSQGVPSWWVVVMLSAWVLHRAGRARRRARARLMYGLTILGVAMGLTACGEAPADAHLGQADDIVRQAIVQGTAAHDTYLAVGALVMPGVRGSDYDVLNCTGTLIAPDVVLTAAHCLTSYKHYAHVGQVMPKLGFRPGADTALGGWLGTVQVRYTVMHPNYWQATLANNGIHNTFCPSGDTRSERQEACDKLLSRCHVPTLAALRDTTVGDVPGDAALQASLQRVRNCINEQDEALLRQAGYLGVQDDRDFALLFLENPVPGARIAQLPTQADVQALVKGMTLAGVGYGDREADATSQVPRGEKRVMRNTLAELGHWELRLGMAPPQACHADSGGPLFFSDSGPTPTVLGVVSRLADSRSTACDKGAIYGRVDREVEWIEHTLEEVCERGLRYGCRAHAAPAQTQPDIPSVAPRAADGCQVAPHPVAWLMGLGMWGWWWAQQRRKRVLEGNLGR